MESRLMDQIISIFKSNPLSTLLDIHIVDLADRSATMTMTIADHIHPNAYGLIHGGTLFTLADSVMGVAGLTTGHLVVTNDINIRFVSNSKRSKKLTAIGKLIHIGQTSVIAEAEIRDNRQRLLVIARGSYALRHPIQPPQSVPPINNEHNAKESIV